MSLYDDVLNCPDTHCRKEALDKLCNEKVAEGMERSLLILEKAVHSYASELICQAAKDLEDS